MSDSRSALEIIPEPIAKLIEREGAGLDESDAKSLAAWWAGLSDQDMEALEIEEESYDFETLDLEIEALIDMENDNG